MSEPARYDDLASIDTTDNPEPWLRMLRGMWPGDENKRARYRRLFGMLRAPRGGRILEVGCGAGGAVRLCAESIDDPGIVVGVDPSRLAVLDAQRLTRTTAARHGPRFLAMDGRRLGFANASFDAVFCSRVLVHAPEPDVILAEMFRVLRPGGRMLLVEPDRDAMLSSIEFDEVNRVFWSERRSVNPRIGRDLYRLLHDLSLTVEHVEPAFNVSLRPPPVEQVRDLEAQLASGSGEWWSLVEAGRITAAQLRGYARSLRKAMESGVYLRTDLELVYVAQKS